MSTGDVDTTRSPGAFHHRSPARATPSQGAFHHGTQACDIPDAVGDKLGQWARFIQRRLNPRPIDQSTFLWFFLRRSPYDPRSAIQNRMFPNAAHWPFGSIGSTLAHFSCEKSRLAAASTKIESGVLLQTVCRTWTQNGLFIAHTSKNRCAQTNRDQKIAQDT